LNSCLQQKDGRLIKTVSILTSPDWAVEVLLAVVKTLKMKYEVKEMEG
jgi:hypothetical protein